MYTGIFFSIEAIFYLGLLLLVYFRKKVFKSKENKIYSVLIVVTFIEMLIEIILDIVGPLYETIPEVSYTVAKIYCIFIIMWNCLLCMYVFLVALKMKEKERNSNISKTILLSFGIALSVASFLLPIDFFYSGKVAYTYGPSVNVVYVSAIMYSLIGASCLIWNLKEWRDKRFIPVIILVTLGSLCSYVQYKNPGLLLATAVHAFITFLMYFTIENPDMKTIEEIHKAKEISDNANEEKTLFLYNMTNEIRGITKDINKEADNILDEADNKKVNIEVIEDSAREIKGSTAKFTTITNEILDVSNMDGASIRVYDEKYNIKLILKSLINTYKKRCDDKNIVFRSNINSDMPEFLYGDGINLKKVIDILLDNSVKYTNDGYVELDVNTIIKNDIVRLIITVEDSGIGIDSEKLGSLFVNKKDYKEENYDLNDTLYNVKKIITMMGGTIIPNSTYGKGTNMKIILDQKLVIDNNKLDEYEKRIDKKDILYVGSDGKLINKLLKGKEVDLEIIELGKEALDKIRGNKRYDLILLDDDIKPLSGLIIMKKLFMIKSFNTKVILLSSNNEYIDNYDKYGFNEVISEPIDEDIFIDKINKYLER